MAEGHPGLPVIPSSAPEDRAPSTPPRPASILDRSISLTELLDLKSFRDVCASFVDLYRIGVKVFDEDGTKLVDLRVGDGDWCGYIFSNPEGRGRCTNLVSRVKGFGYPELKLGQTVEQHCFSGLKYVVMPISYAGDQLGRVIYGPFMPEHLTAPGPEVSRFPDFDPARLWSYGKDVRRAPDETIARILEGFRRTIDTIVAIAYKALMTQHLHLESITASYEDVYRSNQQLRAALARQEELDKLKASFLAMISHELRTPLTSIIGYSEMLLEGMAGDLQPEQNEFVGTIKEKGEALLELIGSILDLSKIESGTVQLLLSEVAVGEVMEAAERTIVPQAQKKNLTVTVEHDPELPLIVADREKLGQSVVNLLTNAVKFTPKGGRIRARASAFRAPRRYTGVADRFGPEDESWVRIDVSDTGIGIPEEKLQDVFKAFYQVDNSFTREFGGSGLGLAIVRSFVEAHGGEVWVESEERAGTTFSLLLPLEAQKNRVAFPSSVLVPG